MEILLALAIGVLSACGFHLLMSPSISRLILGILLLSQAANLLIFAAAGLGPGASPIIREDETRLLEPHADPLPQALVLTAIVIGFAIAAFAMVLLKRAYERLGSENVDQLNRTEQW